MLQNIKPINTDLYLDQGDTYYKELTFSDGIMFLNLVGYVFDFELKEYVGTKALAVNFLALPLVPSSGGVALSAAILETALLNRPRYVYRLLAKLPNPVQPPIAIPPDVQLPPNPPLETVVLMFGQIHVQNF
jgi:hypothetical protein